MRREPNEPSLGRGVALVLLLTACAAPQPRPAATETTVRFDGEWIVYHGDISEAANAQVRRLFSEHPETLGLKISSGGGSITLGMALGEWLLTTGRDVYVDGECFSSCANYVFPAGKRKIVSADAVIGWHGGTRQWPSAEAMCLGQHGAAFWSEEERLDCLATARQARDREARLYRLFGVDPDIMVFGLRHGANYPSRPTDVGWTYSIADLERFGITDIHVEGGQWEPGREIDGQTVCLMDVERGRCPTP